MSDTEDFDDDAPTPAAQATADGAAEPVAERVPNFYREIFPAGPCDGFYRKLGAHALSFVDRGSDTLLVTFDNLSAAGHPGFDIEAWGGKFIRDRGWNHLGVHAQGPTWYRDARIIAQLEALRDQGLFARHRRVTLAGTSMGGFAALAFADLAPGCNVLAFSPQATLHADYAPWEGRFQRGREQDWTLPRSHAGDHLAGAGNVWVVYDPFVIPDRRHVDLLPMRAIQPLKCFNVGHKSALALRRMGRLKEIMQRAVDGTLDADWFYTAMRDRKRIFLFRQVMERHLTQRGKADRIPRMIAAFKKHRRSLPPAGSDRAGFV
ncbi:hypothetical protein ACEYYB_10705 [Paracoccus sp. p4-l81]|uniref:hypothetical protein n=1 Tax=unclassified Paracoccus (in: a-proteobacteria) TaxID=2688777 RepID=UPI0035B7D108